MLCESICLIVTKYEHEINVYKSNFNTICSLYNYCSLFRANRYVENPSHYRHPSRMLNLYSIEICSILRTSHHLLKCSPLQLCPTEYCVVFSHRAHSLGSEASDQTHPGRGQRAISRCIYR